MGRVEGGRVGAGEAIDSQDRPCNKASPPHLTLKRIYVWPRVLGRSLQNRGAGLEALAEAIIRKCHQIRAYGQYGLIALNVIKLADERPSAPIRQHLDLVGELLPDSYLYGQHITEPWYKYVVLSNNQGSARNDGGNGGLPRRSTAKGAA